jgi:mannose-6-phosphate isomerase-like protein (cupin superfamily)
MRLNIERVCKVATFHHRALPTYSTLLSGRTPPDEVGFPSERLQIWFNHTTDRWVDAMLHIHSRSDECFIVLSGSLVVEVDGTQITIGPREFCCFPSGTPHAVVDVHLPVETLMIRAPSIDDKVYQDCAELQHDGTPHRVPHVSLTPIEE